MTCCWWCKHDVGDAIIKVPNGMTKTTKYKEATTAEYERMTKEEQEKVHFVRDTFKAPVHDPRTLKYEVEGFFCTFECARAYLSVQQSHDMENRIYYLNHLRRLTLKDKDKEVTLLKKAPSWKLLDIFGGPLTYEQFRSDKEEWILSPKNIIDSPAIGRKKHQPISQKRTWKETEKVIASSHQKTDQLKIKRSNPRANVSGFGDISSKLGLKKSTKD
jgi:hypothetical protein